MILGTFVDILPADITEMLGYSKDLITDLTPLMLPIIAIGLGIFIVVSIIGVIKR
jgi:hypothetical protein